MKLMILLTMLVVIGCEDPGKTYYESCSVGSISGINGGTVVNHKQGLVKIKAETSFCTGFLLNDNLAITAAHCLVDFSDGKHGEFNLQVKYYDPCEGERVISQGVSEFWIHPKYGGLGPNSWDNDLAVIRHSQSWLNTGPADYLSIWSGSFQPINYVTLYGIGLDSNKTFNFGVLKRGNRELIDFTRTSLKVLAGEVRYCHGDSGGPFFKQEHGDNLVLGILVATTSPHDKIGNCANYGDNQYGCRLNTEKMAWIEDVTGTVCYYSISKHGHGMRTCW